MIRRKIWATATCCLALAGAARAQTASAPKANLGTPQPAASAPTPGYPQYIPRTYTVPTPPTYAAPTPNLGTSPAPGPSAPPAPLMMSATPTAVAEPASDSVFAADAAFPWPQSGGGGSGTIPTIPAPGTTSPKLMPGPGQATPHVSGALGAPAPVVIDGTVMSGPLVSGPINGGPILEGSGGTPFLDGVLNGSLPKFWVSGEFLNWKLRGPHVPATQGPNRIYPRECELLGSWEFTGLHPPPGQHAPFTVTFAIDADGILHLHAEEIGTGHALAASVDRGIGLP